MLVAEEGSSGSGLTSTMCCLRSLGMENCSLSGASRAGASSSLSSACSCWFSMLRAAPLPCRRTRYRKPEELLRHKPSQKSFAH